MLRIADTIEAGTVVGIIVATFMGVLIIGLMLTYCVHRHQESKAAKITAQQLVSH